MCSGTSCKIDNRQDRGTPASFSCDKLKKKAINSSQAKQHSGRDTHTGSVYTTLLLLLLLLLLMLLLPVVVVVLLLLLL